MKTDNSSEIFPIVTEDGKVIGSASRYECHSGTKLLHPVVHLHIFNNEGNLFLQKRPKWKDIQPGKWDTAVGGHVDFGESVEEALLREAFEEVGIHAINYRFIKKYVFESAIERELVNVFTTINESPQPSDELDGGRFWTQKEILENLNRDVFTPNFEKEYIMLFSENDINNILMQ